MIGTELSTYELLDSSVGIVTLLTGWTVEEKKFNYRQSLDQIWDHPTPFLNSTGVFTFISQLMHLIV